MLGRIKRAFSHHISLSILCAVSFGNAALADNSPLFGFFNDNIGIETDLSFARQQSNQLLFVGADTNRTYLDTSCENKANQLATQLCYIANKLDDIIALNKPGLKVALVLTDLFYDTTSANTHFPIPGLISEAEQITPLSHPQLAQYSPWGYLSQQSIYAVMSALEQVVFANHPERQNLISVIYEVDEPYLMVPYPTSTTQLALNFRFGELQQIASFAKSIFPDARVANVFSQTELINPAIFPRVSPLAQGWSLIPSDLDIVGFDCYSSCTFGNPNPDFDINQLYLKLRTVKWPSQKIILVPEVGLPLSGGTIPAWECGLPWTQPLLADYEAKLQSYMDLYESNKWIDAVGMFAFLWQNLTDSSGNAAWCGASNYPGLTQSMSWIGRQITSGN